LEAWIEFGRGPLFRLSFSLMLLGLLRILALTFIGMVEAYRRNPDKKVPWKDLAWNTVAWLVPVRRLWTKRPVYGAASLLFHVGLILVPLFSAAHVLLWKRSVGFAWPPLPMNLANWLTAVVIIAGLAMFLGRLLHSGARKISRLQDYMWLLLLIIPFATGYVCSNAVIGPKTYQRMMFLHVYSADLILVMIPFTKIAHCVLAPLSLFVTGVAWKFPAGVGDKVTATLGYAKRPAWVEKARLTGKEVQAR
jgi:nitrate reductase gamma subunit